MSASGPAVVHELPTELRVRLSPTLRRSLEAQTRATGCTPEEYVREALLARLQWEAGAAARDARASADSPQT
jgi:hypothetical protein